MYTSLKKLSNLLILKQEGTSRQERYMPALHVNDTLMDNRSIQDYIGYMQRLAKNLLFIHPDEDHIDFNESWEHYFKNDILFLIANVSTKNVSDIKKVYKDLYSNFEKNRTVENFLELVEYTLSRFTKIDSWYVASFSDHALEQDFTLYIRSYLQQELEIIREMMMYSLHKVDNRERTERFRNDLFRMSAIWSVKERENISLREKIFAGNDDQEKLAHAYQVLHKTFDTIFHATETIVKKCKTYFTEAIKLEQHYHHNHNPHVALVIAFLKLYEYERKELNKIPQRHLRFYYNDVLRIKSKEAIPDQTYIIFELAKGFETALIRKGTRLSAGKDKNRELIYETEKDIVINKAKVSALHTVYVDLNEHREVLNYYSYTFPEPVGQVPSTDFQETGISKPFGEKAPGAVSRVGFAVSSSQLFLARGERKVTVTFESPVEIGPCLPGGQQEPFEIFETGIIKLLLTGEKGWIDSDSAVSEINIESLRKTAATIIELVFTISIRQEQAIVGFNKEIHEGHFDTGYPVLQCILKYPTPNDLEEESAGTRNEKIDQLCMLQHLQVVGIKIKVQVGSIQFRPSFDGIRELILENDESPLDYKKPFFPFTAVPKVGSCFFIGCEDFFYKEIQEFSLNIEWVLPDNFDSYYQKYLPPYDSNKFMVTLSKLAGKRWQRISDYSIIDVNKNEPKFRSIKPDVDKLKQVNRFSPSSDPISEFDDVKMDGTLRLKLNYPDFGHSIYPQLITSAVMEAARDKASGTDYFKIIRNHLDDSKISIKYPDDIRQRNGSLKVIYDILEFATVDKARMMFTKALSDILRKYNIDNLVTRRPGEIDEETGDDEQGRMLVNDRNLIERFLGFFRKAGLIDKKIHYDQDEQELDEVAEDIQEKVLRKADFMMPSDNELIKIILNETNTAIYRTVVNIVDKIMVLKIQGNRDPEKVAEILEKELNEVNIVINDMIAKKIAIYISVNEIPPPPYTPLVNNVSLNYSSIKELSGANGDKTFQITPFGIIETGLLNSYPGAQESNDTRAVNHIFPERLIDTDRQYRGMLFIGISDLLPNQNLSLLVQLAEGTRKNDKKPPVLQWFYFRDNAWEKMSNDKIISDSTHGLQTTGIIEFSIPNNAGNKNILFEVQSLYWICAAVEQDANAFPDLIDIKSQAVVVTFKDHKNNPMHLALPLEAEKIKTLIDEIPEVKKISQPVSSSNGKMGENEREYNTRVSERLRHKSRAINNWDYERLVLEEFPSFYKVKCLNNYYQGDFAIGHITIVPIADFRNKKYAGSNMLLPITNYIDLRNIEKFLYTKSSPFVKIHAVNPLLEHVLISCKVKFHDYVNKGFYLKKLNDDLINFLTPWAGGDLETISFSAKIYASSIINFIDSQEYVNYVVNLVMQQYSETEDGVKVFVKNAEQFTSLVETELKTGHSILVSAPKHEIELVE